MCMSAPSTPPVPPLPPAPPEPAKLNDAAVTQARNETTRRAKAATGAASTSLTTPSGLSDATAVTKQKTALGQ